MIRAFNEGTPDRPVRRSVGVGPTPRGQHIIVRA